MLFKKCASYLSGLLLSLPLVAVTDAAASADLRPLLAQLPQHCAPLPTNLDDNARQQLHDFYAQREGQPAWADAGRRRQLAGQLALTRERVRKIKLESLAQLRRILRRRGLSKEVLL